MTFIPFPFLAALLASVLLLLAGPGHAADKLAVTASFSILGDLVGVVGGGRVAVTSLVGPDQDAHVFEPRPADARNLLQARLLVVNGLEFEPWARRLANSAGFKGETLVVSNGVKARALPAAKGHGHGHDHGHVDPHAWQDPRNVIVYVRNIAAALSKLDPDGATQYAARRDAYVKELQALDSWAQEQFGAIPVAQRRVMTSHDAFGYLAARYQLRFLAPRGLSTDGAASAKDVAELVRQLRQQKVRAVFVENMSDPKLVAQLARDAGAVVGGSLYSDALSAPGQAADTYLKLMRHNVTLLAQAMVGN